jgi:hypothetical protein
MMVWLTLRLQVRSNAIEAAIEKFHGRHDRQKEILAAACAASAVPLACRGGDPDGRIRDCELSMTQSSGKLAAMIRKLHPPLRTLRLLAK